MFSSNQPLLANQLPISEDFSSQEKDPLNNLQNLYRRVANVVNTKEGALYSLQEIGTFQQFFSTTTTSGGTLNAFVFRNTYRKVFDMVQLNGGNIPSGTTVSFPHGITGITMCTRIYGTATTVEGTPKFLPLPYPNATSNQTITIYCDATNVYLINGAGQQPLSQAYIILEYVKQN
jgi:hypothetical protein